MEVTVSPAVWQTSMGNQNVGRPRTTVYFYDREVQITHKSLEAGRPIFDMQVFIKKIPPGDKLVEIDRKANSRDFINYPAEYEAYKKKQTVPVSGTSLDMWPQLSRAQVAEFKALNIFTVEQMAELPDQYGQKIMGFQGYKQKAQAFLRAAQGQAEFEKMENALKQRDEEISKLREQQAEVVNQNKAVLAAMEAMQQQMAELSARKKPGRPKKEVA